METYQLLISHAERWAAKSGRPLDPALLETALDLRDVHDERPGTSWPAGSAHHLMTVRWPGHGPLGEPDADGLVATLDTYWRFLRATGRMGSDSADPKDLAREARRAVPEMRERCADPAAYGFSKNLMAFGEATGISLEGAATAEELQQRLDAIQEAFNAQSYEDRVAWTPGTVGAGSLRSQQFTDMAHDWLAGIDLEEYAAEHGLSAWDDEGYGEEDEDDIAFAPRDPAVVAAELHASSYFRDVMRLVDWIGEAGREATQAGLLRPAVAREVIAELGLDQWRPDTTGRTEATWRSAGEHLGLDRLFLPALEVGFLEKRGRRLYAVAERPGTDEEWVVAGLVMLVSLHRRYAWTLMNAPLQGILLSLGFTEVRTVPELRQWWRGAPGNWVAQQFSDRPEVANEFSDGEFDLCLAGWSDTGIWRRTGDHMEVTELGLDFLRVLIALTDEEESGV